jgi:hypothetical protein
MIKEEKERLIEREKYLAELRESEGVEGPSTEERLDKGDDGCWSGTS